MKFGEFIREQRFRKTMTLGTLSSVCEISLTYLSDIERGRRNAPGKEILFKIRRALELDHDEWCQLLNLGAQTHHDIPNDIKEFLLNNTDWYKKLRTVIYKEDECNGFDQ